MPRRLSLTVAAAACSLAAIPASGMGAVAAVQDDRLAAATLTEIPGRLDLAKETGARVARVDLFWSDIALSRPASPTDPNDPAYDWTATDAKLSGLASRGITPLISVYSSPTWTTGGRKTDTQYNPYAPKPGDYGKFMAAVSKRYSGTFTPTGGTSPLPRVRLIEIWNEPNLKSFFRVGGRTNLKVYLRLVREAYGPIKRNNRRAIVIAGVGGPRSTNGAGNLGARQWLNGIVRSPLNVKFDAYSQHIYPNAAPFSRTKAFPSWNSINEILRTLDTRRAREIRTARGRARIKLRRAPKLKLYVTEAGYTTQATPFRKVKVSEAQQAKYLSQIFRHPQVRRNRRLSAIVWFNLQDNPNWPAGLVREDGSEKRAWAMFKSWSGKGALTPDLRP